MSNNSIKKAKKYIANHKKEVIIVGASVVIITGTVVVARHHIKELNMLNHAKDIQIDCLEKACKAKDLQIVELKELCARKDRVFSSVISDSLRHGSSEAGRHMAERKAYLNLMAC